MKELSTIERDARFFLILSAVSLLFCVVLGLLSQESQPSKKTETEFAIEGRFLDLSKDLRRTLEGLLCDAGKP